MECTSCCLNCRTGHPAARSEDVYALDNLLQVGTALIQLSNDLGPEDCCEHIHASDGWHPYGGTSRFLPLSNLVDVKFCQDLEFLVKHRFVDATYRLQDNKVMIIKVYLIPYDLAGTKGVLRNRKDGTLAPGKRCMRSLLQRVGMISEQDNRTLAEIYSELPSPKPVAVPGYGGIAARLLDDEDNLEGLGLRSELYHYQRRSVAALMQHELDQRNVDNPVYTTLTTVDGRTFFFQPGTAEVLLEKQMVSPCRGGILCEELGTGKTVMIIALILATLNQLPEPEESLLDDRPVMTPLSLRLFPSSECKLARKRYGCKTDSQVPTFVEILLHKSRTCPDANISRGDNERRLSIEDRFESLPLAEMRRRNVPFYLHYKDDALDVNTNRRRRNDSGPKRMYLSAATLVVVPPNLLSQWDREIIKHSDTPLRVLMLRAKTEMPSVQELATDFDIILMPYTRFTAEASKKDVSKLHTWKPCRCPELPNSRVPNCKCQNTETSPFLQIRWKRLVIDEGHVSATTSTILTHFAKLMSVERRWIVTGTPTTNLLGLGLGKRIMEETSTTEDTPPSPMEVDVDSHDSYLHKSASNIAFDTTADSTSSSDIETPACSPPADYALEQSHTVHPRIWNSYDREDLRKLGNMMTHFIAVPQFASDPKLMQTHVTEALLDRGGPRLGAIRVLSQIMGMVMTRHRVEDVEGDVVLPPLTHESVMLDLDPLMAISYNMLQAGIAINAVDSERKDQDYLFHPMNAEYLQTTVKNMSQLMFWSVDDQLFNADQLNQDAEKHIARALERGASQEDVTLLQNAFKHVAIAANNPLWRAAQFHEDVSYRVYSMPPAVYDAWRRTPGSQDSTNPAFVGYLSADRLVKLYAMVREKPLIGQEDMVKWGRAVALQDDIRRKAYIASQKGKDRRSSSKTNLLLQSETANATRGGHAAQSQMAESALKKASARETLKEMQTELDHSMSLLESAMEEEGEGAIPTSPAKPGSLQHSSGLSRLAASSCLAPVRIGASGSSKLNYIINEVLKYSPSEKFLIFSDSELTLAHVAEALELVHVKFLRFTAQIPPQYREQLVLTFETSETYRVFLMELKHGARGLNLVSASRVIFCEPVWQADVESQAIKRVHRIGQTRPITVKTLAIRGTAEENMVARRHALHNSQDKLPKLIEEAGMRDFIANPRFIDASPQHAAPVVDFPLIDVPPLPETATSLKITLKKPFPASPSKKRVWVGGPLPDDEQPQALDAVAVAPEANGPFAKRARTIKFVC